MEASTEDDWWTMKSEWTCVLAIAWCRLEDGRMSCELVSPSPKYLMKGTEGEGGGRGGDSEGE